MSKPLAGTPAMIIENLKGTLAVIEAAPEERFDLALYYQGQGCGTLACAAGWQLMDDVKNNVDPASWLAYLAKSAALLGRTCADGVKAKQAWTDAAERLACDSERYGRDSFSLLFCPTGMGENDSELFPYVQHGIPWVRPTDKELAIARFKLRIQQLEAA